MRIAVGAITRRRPEGLRRLLESFARMDRPEGAEIEFVFCENDDESRVAGVVEAFRAAVPEPVQLMLEPQKGIPFARNRVLAAALEQGFDFLTFVDDDEVVKPDWLVNLNAAMSARHLDLAGGPVEFLGPDVPLSSMQRAVFRHVIERSHKRISGRAEAEERGLDHRLAIYTNNWCLRLDAVRASGIRFDEAMRYTGGSDTRFSHQMQSAGARIGWVPSAWVRETVPVKRLSLGYYVGRARDQTTNSVLIKRRKPAVVWLRAFQRLTDAFLNILSVPIRGRRGLVNAAFKVGMAAGFMRGSIGLRSRHYSPRREALHTEGH